MATVRTAEAMEAQVTALATAQRRHRALSVGEPLACAAVMVVGMVDVMWLGDRILPTDLWAAVYGLCALGGLLLVHAPRLVRVHRGAHFLAMAALTVVSGVPVATLRATGVMPGHTMAMAGMPGSVLAVTVRLVCLAVAVGGILSVTVPRFRMLAAGHRGEVIGSSLLLVAMLGVMSA